MALEIADYIRKAGFKVRVFYLDDVEPLSPMAHIFDTQKLTVISALSIKNCLHTHGFRPVMVGVFLKHMRPKLNILTTLHIQFIPDMRFLHSRFRVKLAFRLFLWALSKYNSVVCISTSMQRYYSKHRRDLRSVVIRNFRNPVQTEECSIEINGWAKEQRLNRRGIFLFAGALIERKNVLPLINWVALNSGFSLVVCGSGCLASDVAEVSSLCDRVLNLGFVDDLGRIFPHVDGLILPSFTEGLPLVVLEAASFGVPSVLSNITVHRELAASGLGYVFNHKSFVDLEDALRRVMSDRLSSDDHHRIRRIYISEFSPDGLGSRYVDIVRRGL